VQGPDRSETSLPHAQFRKFEESWYSAIPRALRPALAVVFNDACLSFDGSGPRWSEVCPNCPEQMYITLMTDGTDT